MTIRVAMVGLGGIGQAHLERLARIGGVRVVAVYDADRARAERIAGTLGARVCDEAEQCAASGAADALFICAPPTARGSLEKLAAAAGIHLFTEKPLGLDPVAVRAKEAVIRDSGILHSTGYCMRYSDIVQRAKRYLADKTIELVCASRLSSAHPPAWWSQLELSGGQFVDQTTHQVDMIRYVAGEFAVIDATFARRALHRRNPQATIYDIGIARFELASGAIGTIANTCLLPAGDRAYTEWIGDGFAVRIAGSELTIADSDGERVFRSAVDPLYEQDRAFIEAVRTGSRDGIRCDYAEGRKTLEVTLAANRSAEAGAPVRLDAG